MAWAKSSPTKANMPEKFLQSVLPALNVLAKQKTNKLEESGSCAMASWIGAAETGQKAARTNEPPYRRHNK
jgi:hypothetical protein